MSWSELENGPNQSINQSIKYIDKKFWYPHHPLFYTGRYVLEWMVKGQTITNYKQKLKIKNNKKLKQKRDKVRQ